jgi:hypothetical protein
MPQRGLFGEGLARPLSACYGCNRESLVKLVGAAHIVGFCAPRHEEGRAAARSAPGRVIQITFPNAFPEFSSRNTFGRGSR